MKITSIVLACLLANLLLLTGCQNTAAGFGKDMQVNGQEIQKSVDSDDSKN